jgi:hypothetical protein
LSLVSIAEAQHPAPVNKSVPAVPCKGGGDCDSGENICKPIRVGGGSASTPTLTFTDSGYAVTSDGKGPYFRGTANVITGVGNAAVLLFRPARTGDTSQTRRFNVDLRYPVPGDIGLPLGIISDSLWVDMNAQWYTETDFTQHHLLEIPAGKTVTAEQLNVGFAISGVAHALQMGPQPWGHCYSNGTAIFGTGTTRGTITRSDKNTFVVDLPPGSVGRLFDVHLHDPHAVNRGLYYVSLHFIVKI